MINVELTPGLTVVPEHQLYALRHRLQHLGVPVYVLETGTSPDRAAFFEAVRRVLPLDPPLASSRSWDALADSLWEGLESLGEKQIAILWPDAYAMMSASREDYEIAISVLADVANSLHDARESASHRVDVAVYAASREKNS